MKLVFILSYLYLIISFLLYKKIDKKISIISSIVYVLCLLFCYNVVIVSLVSFCKLGGSLFVYSLVNYFVGTIFNLISYKRKEIQKYKFNKREFVGFLIVVLCVLLVCFFRFRGFEVLTYETGDPSVHYRQALYFQEELEILNGDNSKDLVYLGFDRIIPISYVNCGFLMNVFSGISAYKIFIFFDVFCLMVSSLLFIVTMLEVLGKKKYLYSLILTIIYLLGFPLNNLIFGFSYLGLGVMVINLLFLTVFKVKNFNDYILFKLFILFCISFSVFFSYYLFMPCIYLSLGIYYIWLWKKKRISLRKMLLYSFVTLIIPFLIGLIYFILPGFFGVDSVNVVRAIVLDGYIYSNKSIRYFFLLVSIVFLVNIIRRREKVDYFSINFIGISLYVLLFYIMYRLSFSGLYYFYKLFYLYWLFSVFYIGKLLNNRCEYLYTLFIFIVLGMCMVYVNPNNIFSVFLVKSNIFSWNIKTFREENILYTKEELELVSESIKYENICEIEDEFLISGDRLKSSWYYAITGNVPLYGYKYGEVSQLGNPTITFNYWKGLDTSKCLIYFYENKKIEEIGSELEVLYSNKDGAIVMKK